MPGMRAADPAPERETLRQMIRKLGPAAVLGAIASILPPLGSIVLFWKINTIGPWLREHGVQGLVLYMVAFAVLSGIAVVPTYASSVLGGWAFGFTWGYPGAASPGVCRRRNHRLLRGRGLCEGPRRRADQRAPAGPGRR